MSPSDLQPRLGEIVRRRRVTLGMSQEEFADCAGLHRTYIGGFERGESNLTLANLSLVASGLGLPLSRLLAEAEVPDTQSTVESSADLGTVVASLSPERKMLIGEMVQALTREIESTVSPDSDICVPEFARCFQDRLVLYHAMNDYVLKKKTFEYAFYRASKAAGRRAELTRSPVNPGTDALVDGVSFSLKTEASRGIQVDSITISKLMEARWIRECRTGEDFVRAVRDRIVPHLSEYQRILMLRAFEFEDDQPGFEYHLVEIPRDLLLSVSTLSGRAFTRRIRNGSSRADVMRSGSRAFALRLDGSVEKVTISALRADLCKRHGRWRIPKLQA